MPRVARRKISCAYAEDPKEKAKAARALAKARQAALTPEEKEQKKLEAAERSAARKLKKEWEEGLTPWRGDPNRGQSFENGTKVCVVHGGKTERVAENNVAAL